MEDERLALLISPSAEPRPNLNDCVAATWPEKGLKLVPMSFGPNLDSLIFPSPAGVQGGKGPRGAPDACNWYEEEGAVPHFVAMRCRGAVSSEQEGPDLSLSLSALAPSLPVRPWPAERPVNAAFGLVIRPEGGLTSAGHISRFRAAGAPGRFSASPGPVA